MNVNSKTGQTRSVLRREYLLHTPDAFVRTPMPCVTNGVAIVHASSRLGADFLLYTAELEKGGALLPVEDQRFVWVLEGELQNPLHTETSLTSLEKACFLYLPSNFSGAVLALTATRLIVIEKSYQPLPGKSAPEAFAGREADVEALPLNDDPGVKVKSLLPSQVAFDFAVNTMTYASAASLAQVEVHHMEHGLLMLEGSGTYRLGDDFHAVHAGDCIWMAPYCPQWFVADRDCSAKYLIYKDWNRSPAL